jgi:hypothetical protein
MTLNSQLIRVMEQEETLTLFSMMVGYNQLPCLKVLHKKMITIRVTKSTCNALKAHSQKNQVQCIIHQMDLEETLILLEVMVEPAKSIRSAKVTLTLITMII